MVPRKPSLPFRSRCSFHLSLVEAVGFSFAVASNGNVGHFARVKFAHSVAKSLFLFQRFSAACIHQWFPFFPTFCCKKTSRYFNKQTNISIFTLRSEPVSELSVVASKFWLGIFFSRWPRCCGPGPNLKFRCSTSFAEIRWLSLNFRFGTKSLARRIRLRFKPNRRRPRPFNMGECKCALLGNIGQYPLIQGIW